MSITVKTIDGGFAEIDEHFDLLTWRKLQKTNQWQELSSGEKVVMSKDSEKDDIKVGDVVVVKGMNYPKMTVEELGINGTALCVWFEPSARMFNKNYFNKEILVKFKKESSSSGMSLQATVLLTTLPIRIISGNQMDTINLSFNGNAKCNDVKEHTRKRQFIRSCIPFTFDISGKDKILRNIVFSFNPQWKPNYTCYMTGNIFHCEEFVIFANMKHEKFTIETWEALPEDVFKWRKTSETQVHGVVWSYGRHTSGIREECNGEAEFTYSHIACKVCFDSEIVEITNKKSFPYLEIGRELRKLHGDCLMSKI